MKLRKRRMTMNQTSGDELNFEEPVVEETEVVQLQEGQEVPIEEPGKKEEPKPTGVTLTQEQYDELLKGKDSTEALSKGLEGLVETLKVPQQPANVQPQQGFDDKELEELAFKPGGFKEAVQKVAAQMLGQTQGPLAVGLVQQNRKLLKVDPKTSELFNKYEGEIEKKVQSLPVNIRMMPDVYEQAYRQVVFEKQDEIINDKAQKIADAAVKQALEKAGIKTEGGEETTPSKPAMYQEGQVRGTVQKAPTKKLYITTEDVQDMMNRGMDPKDKDQVESYIKNIKSRRAK